MIVFRKARNPQQTLNDLDGYLRTVGDKPVRWLAREVQSWGEFSYDEIAALIESGQLDALIDWQERWAGVVNQTLAPMWTKAIEEASRKATKGMTVLSDSNDYVKAWVTSHGGELITLLSDESRKAISNILLRGQGLRMAPRDIAKDIRPLIGLTDRQAQANLKYKDVVYQKLLDNGMSESKARERSEAAALRYAGKQHRYRAESIVLTENAFAYNRGAHMGVSQSIADGYMGRCEMVWTTAGTNRVCGRCMELKDTVVGTTDQSGVTIPPLHPRCRCAIMYREVGAPRVMQPKPKEFREFKTPEETFAYFGRDKNDTSKLAGQWVATLSKEEQVAIRKYSGSYYKSMNGILRGTRAESEYPADKLKEIKQFVSDCDSALAKSVLPIDILTHRQLGMDMLKTLKETPDGIFIDEGFTSTTLIKDSFESKIDVEIKVPAGKGVGMYITSLARYEDEYEFLLARGTKFKVYEIDESGDRPLVRLEVIGRALKAVAKNFKLEKRASSNEKFMWSPADVKIQNAQGLWVRGDKFIDD